MPDSSEHFYIYATVSRCELELVRSIAKQEHLSIAAFIRRSINAALSTTGHRAHLLLIQPRRYRPRRFTPDQVEQMLALHAQGMTLRYIGKEFNCSFSLIRHRLGELGVTPHSKGYRPPGWNRRLRADGTPRKLRSDIGKTHKRQRP